MTGNDFDSETMTRLHLQSEVDVASRQASQRHQGGSWREYAAGGSASLLAIVITYPINKCMFRQQVHNIPPAEALRQLWREGAIHIYRGLLSPLLMRTLSQSVMFGTYAQYTWRLQQSPLHTFAGNRACKLVGAAAAGASEACLMPLERVQGLMQHQEHNARFRNTPHALWELRHYGLTEYYRGISAILVRNCLGNILFFSAREQLKESLPEQWTSAKSGGYRSHVADFIGGACLGAFISTVFYPVNVTKTHMQLKIGGRFLRLRTVFMRLLTERGVKGMFRGVHVNYTRSFLSWGIINVAYENILRIL